MAGNLLLGITNVSDEIGVILKGLLPIFGFNHANWATGNTGQIDATRREKSKMAASKMKLNIFLLIRD